MATFLGVPAAPPSLEGVDAVVVGVGPAGDAVRTADHLPLDGSRPHLSLGVDALRDLVVVDAGDAGGESAAASLALTAAVAGAVPLLVGAPHPVAPGQALVQFAACPRPVESRHAVHVGVRGYGTAAGAGRIYEMAELSARRLHPCLDEAFAALCRDGDVAVVLSVDVDAADPAVAPATRTPEPGGLTARQLLDAVRRCALELPVVGVDVVGLDPELDSRDRRTARLANRVLLEILSGICRRRLEEEQTAD